MIQVVFPGLKERNLKETDVNTPRNNPKVDAKSLSEVEWLSRFGWALDKWFSTQIMTGTIMLEYQAPRRDQSSILGKKIYKIPAASLNRWQCAQDVYKEWIYSTSTLRVCLRFIVTPWVGFTLRKMSETCVQLNTLIESLNHSHLEALRRCRLCNIYIRAAFQFGRLHQKITRLFELVCETLLLDTTLQPEVWLNYDLLRYLLWTSNSESITVHGAKDNGRMINHWSRESSWSLVTLMSENSSPASSQSASVAKAYSLVLFYPQQCNYYPRQLWVGREYTRTSSWPWKLVCNEGRC